eukprot:10167244-Alexandrium_andersonii.AAC.1
MSIGGPRLLASPSAQARRDARPDMWSAPGQVHQPRSLPVQPRPWPSDRLRHECPAIGKEGR